MGLSPKTFISFKFSKYYNKPLWKRRSSDGRYSSFQLKGKHRSFCLLSTQPQMCIYTDPYLQSPLCKTDSYPHAVHHLQQNTLYIEVIYGEMNKKLDHFFRGFNDSMFANLKFKSLVNKTSGYHRDIIRPPTL